MSGNKRNHVETRDHFPKLSAWMDIPIERAIPIISPEMDMSMHSVATRIKGTNQAQAQRRFLLYLHILSKRPVLQDRDPYSAACSAPIVRPTG